MIEHELKTRLGTLNAPTARHIPSGQPSRAGAAAQELLGATSVHKPGPHAPCGLKPDSRTAAHRHMALGVLCKRPAMSERASVEPGAPHPAPPHSASPACAHTTPKGRLHGRVPQLVKVAALLRDDLVAEHGHLVKRSDRRGKHVHAMRALRARECFGQLSLALPLSVKSVRVALGRVRPPGPLTGEGRGAGRDEAGGASAERRSTKAREREKDAAHSGVLRRVGAREDTGLATACAQTDKVLHCPKSCRFPLSVDGSDETAGIRPKSGRAVTRGWAGKGGSAPWPCRWPHHLVASVVLISSQSLRRSHRSDERAGVCSAVKPLRRHWTSPPCRTRPVCCLRPRTGWVC